MRKFWAILVFLGTGCQSFSTRPTNLLLPVDPTIELAGTQTISDLERKALKQSADLVAQRQDAAACEVLDGFVKRYPERCDARLAFAELLFKLKQASRAAVQYEEFLEHNHHVKVDMTRLIQVHGRLADIAEGLKDSYGEHLHKGIALYFTARNYKGISAGETTITPEALLTKAQNELMKAHELNTEEARPCWYLHGVYREQKQTDQAEFYLAWPTSAPVDLN